MLAGEKAFLFGGGDVGNFRARLPHRLKLRVNRRAAGRIFKQPFEFRVPCREERRRHAINRVNARGENFERQSCSPATSNRTRAPLRFSNPIALLDQDALRPSSGKFVNSFQQSVRSIP